MNQKIELPSHTVPVSLIMDVAIRCLKKTDINSLAVYTGKTVPYVKSAVQAGILLNIIDENTDGTYESVKACCDLLKESPDKSQKILIFRRFLQCWNPFIIFLKYLTEGDKPEEAARKVSSFYEINLSISSFSKLLLNWSKSTGLIDSKGNPSISTIGLDEKELYEKLKEQVIDDVNARIYLVSVLSDEVYSWLKEDEKEELINSILKYKSDPRSSIESAGRAFEDILRRLALHLCVDSSKLTGIAQVVNNLYSYKDKSGGQHVFIHSKHNNISVGIADIRNMAGHGKEAKTLERWELSSTGSLGLILTILAMIRSLYSFIIHTRFQY